jgi:hypothetical protein
MAETTTNAQKPPSTFSSGSCSSKLTGSGTDFALILGTANEAASTVANDICSGTVLVQQVATAESKRC